jgi:hypothetical protein
MKRKHEIKAGSVEQVVRNIRLATRKQNSAEDKI